jgi:hydroxyacylglutathione hydrolase
MKKLNAKGPEVRGGLPRIEPLSAKDFRKAIEDKTRVLVDTRDMLAFGGGHIEGALNIGAQPMLSLWAGWLLQPEKSILLVVEEAKLEQVLRMFVRTGYNKFAGYLVGGMSTWDNAGFPLSHIGQLTVHELKDRGSEVQLVDVRSPAEWASGHIPDADYHFLPKLREQLSKLDASKPTAVYCDSGYRASIGASILKGAGFKTVYNWRRHRCTLLAHILLLGQADWRFLLLRDRGGASGQTPGSRAHGASEILPG